jgi:hypothetical protein
VGGLDLHPGLAGSWAQLAPLVGARLDLVVDIANVMGSTPNGWWKDRAAAAERLLEALGGLVRVGMADALLGEAASGAVAGWYPRVTAVVEGQAKAAAADAVEGVDVVAAPGLGDDEIVEVARRLAACQEGAPAASRVVVATADKALQARVRAAGALVMKPGALLRAME